ncbi:Veg family protein [Aerococcaceae bacterium DSM 111022]|nr:Veg family protein [Aerococcaceae bacterium DSM 111022]
MPDNISDIRSLLDERVGTEIKVTVQMGRKKKKERRGILQETYRSVFVVNLDQDENNFERASFSYRDILTDTVAVEFE